MGISPNNGIGRSGIGGEGIGSGGISAGATSGPPPGSLSDFIGPELGNWWDTTLADGSVYMESPARPALLNGDVFDYLRDQLDLGSDWVLGHAIAGRAYVLQGNAIGDECSEHLPDSAYVFGSDGSFLSSESVSAGLCFGATLSLAGTNSAMEEKNCATLNGHGFPSFIVKRGADYITAGLTSSHSIDLPSPPDDQPHTYIMDYDPATDTLDVYVDGVLEGTRDTSADSPVTQLMGQVFIAAGERSGITSENWKLFFALASKRSDISAIHAHLAYGCILQKTPLAAESMVYQGGGRDLLRVSLRYGASDDTWPTNRKTGFSVTDDGVPVGITSVVEAADSDGLDTRLDVQLDSAITGQCLLSYDPAGDGVRATNYRLPLAAVSSLQVTLPQLEITSASVDVADGESVIIGFSDIILASSPADGWIVNVNGSPVTVSGGAISDAQELTLSLSDGVIAGDVVTLDYDDAAGTVTNTNGEALEVTSDYAVVNDYLGGVTLSDLEAIIDTAGVTPADRESYLQDFRLGTGLYTNSAGTNPVSSDGDSVLHAATLYSDGSQYFTEPGSTAPVWYDGQGIKNPTLDTLAKLSSRGETQSFDTDEGVTLVLALKLTGFASSQIPRSEWRSTGNELNGLYFPSTVTQVSRMGHSGATNWVFTPDGNGVAVLTYRTNGPEVQAYCNDTLLGARTRVSRSGFDYYINNINFSNAGDYLIGAMIVNKGVTDSELVKIQAYFRA